MEKTRQNRLEFESNRTLNSSQALHIHIHVDTDKIQ